MSSLVVLWTVGVVDCLFSALRDFSICSTSIVSTSAKNVFQRSSSVDSILSLISPRVKMSSSSSTERSMQKSLTDTSPIHQKTHKICRTDLHQPWLGRRDQNDTKYLLWPSPPPFLGEFASKSPAPFLSSSPCPQNQRVFPLKQYSH